MLKSSLFAAAMLVTILPAQRDKVIPAPALETDANNSSYFPFIYSGGARTQHLIAGDAITPSVSLIREFAYRRDAADKSTFAARMVPNFEVTIGHSKNSPATMSTTFAANRSGTQTTVFKGTYNLPAQPPATGIGTFNVVFKIAQPFLYQRNQGNLLLEFVETGQAQQKNMYLLDAWREDGGFAANFGSNGPLKSQAKYTVVCPAADALAPGGSVSITAAGLDKNYPAAVIYGFSNIAFGAVGLPFDLTPLGAPGNSAYVSLDLVVPLPLTQSGSTWTGTSKLPIPKTAGIGGLALFAQALILDAASNSFGSVWSNGVAMQLAGEARMQMVYQSDSTSATGSYLFGRNYRGGPVIRLNGALQ